MERVLARTIVADPPWRYGSQSGTPSRGHARKFYDTMSLDDIARLRVADLAADDAHLWLWGVNQILDDAYGIARAWGFEPKTLLTWCKKPNGMGLGGTYSLTNEHILFCRRGILPALQRIDTTWWTWARRSHSAKPEGFLDMVELVSPAPRLELFARRQRLGWDTWGNEALPHVELSA